MVDDIWVFINCPVNNCGDALEIQGVRTSQGVKWIMPRKGDTCKCRYGPWDEPLIIKQANEVLSTMDDLDVE